MTFLNALLLAGAAAAAVPLIIHLLNRTRFRVLDWGAMHLLESALKVNSRRVQWQAWLLLLLRMLIPAVLALCLARPVLTAWRTAAGGNQHSVVLVIDNSLSMEAQSERPAESERTDQTRGSDTKVDTSGDAAQDGSCFDTALAEAAELIDRFGPSTEVTILSSGAAADQAAGATFDRRRALRRLREVQVGTGSSPMADVISAGLAELSKARQPRRHLIVLSDFQRSAWEDVPPEALASLKETAAGSGQTPIEVTFIPITPKSADNLSVQIERPPGANVVTHQQSLEVRVAVRNHGRTRIKNLPVVLAADGSALASKTVEVAGDSQVFIVFTCQLQSLGSHLLSVSIDEPEARQAAGLPTSGVVRSDDVARWSVEVIEPVRVGIVSTRSPESKAIDDAMFLNLALSPYAVSLLAGAMSEETAGWAEAHAEADPIKCEIVQPESISDRWLSSLQVVALTDVPVLDDQAAERLVRFVEEGGLLMVWAGDALQSTWYNSHWGVKGSQPFLPCDYDKLSRPSDRSGAPQLRIQPQSYEHPALAFFNRSSNGRLDSVEFGTWFQLACGAEQPTKDDSAEAKRSDRKKSASLTLLSLENGDPLLVENAVGRGRVLQWTTSCDDRWSNLPLREVFVPLVQQLVLYGATASSPRLNLETGQMLAVSWPVPEQSEKDERSSAMIDLLTPQGGRYRLEPQQAAGQKTIQFAGTQFPGAYQLSGIDASPLIVAVNAPAAESELAPLTSSALAGIAERLEADVQDSAAAFWQAEMIKQTGREIWRWVLLALVVFLFAELLLQQSLTRTPV